MSTLVQPFEIHRVTIAEYHQMVASGGYHEDTHVELIDGLVVDMSPRSPQHEAAIRWLIRWMFEQLDQTRYDLMITGSMTIGSSEPEPDVAILPRPASAREHPCRAVLVIEVAVSSHDRDLRTKPKIYAGAVDEYWVVDLEHQQLVVHRDGAEGAYRDVFSVLRPGELTAAALELGPLSTEPLFSIALGERE